jgi:hypothetical protein
MGEYADDYYRKEVKEKFGFDPGSMYAENKPKKTKNHKTPCKLCGKFVAGMDDHLRDAHKEQ